MESRQGVEHIDSGQWCDRLVLGDGDVRNDRHSSACRFGCDDDFWLFLDGIENDLPCLFGINDFRLDDLSRRKVWLLAMCWEGWSIVRPIGLRGLR